MDITITVERLDDTFYVHSDDVPGLHVTGQDMQTVIEAALTAAPRLLELKTDLKDARTRIRVQRDEEAGVFIATSRDIPGLVVEARAAAELASEVVSGIASLEDAEFEAHVDRTLGLQNLSLRLQQGLFDSLPGLAQLNGMGVKPLIRRALTEFVRRRGSDGYTGGEIGEACIKAGISDEKYEALCTALVVARRQRAA